VVVTKHGNGRAYWTVQGKYYSTEQKFYQQGTLSLNLTRDYFKLVPTNQGGKIEYALQPLKGPVVPGDTLAVHLAVNGSPAKYLLIEDPIPAGTEFVQNEDSYNLGDKPASWDYWYTRREFFDDRAAIFATESSGRHESFYLLKVVNPGSFAMSPARVQPMYQPGIQATSDLLHLQVDPAPSPVEDKK
jgi:alpha-2-macroglobulin